jgi:hypothetical protein
MSVMIGSVIHKGKLKGGTDRLFCADCWMVGKKTPVSLSR